MSPVVRLLVAGALLLLGLTAVLFLTGERGACLGPIGVTEVECAATTGIVTTLGFGVPASLPAFSVVSPLARLCRASPGHHGGPHLERFLGVDPAST
jgi:hypothetical protein